MRVLVACEFSGVVRDAFIARGHDAVSWDFLESLSDKGPHVVGDVRNAIDQGNWDLMIAHPPCTYLCNSGVRWLYKPKPNNKQRQAKRWYHMRKAAEFFQFLLNCDIPRIAIENPTMHRYAIEAVGCKESFSIQPWQFGHPETKRTCFWTKNLPPLKPTNIVDGREARIHRMPPSPVRGLLRSITYQGVAEAMADQWGSLEFHCASCGKVSDNGKDWTRREPNMLFCDDCKDIPF